MIWIVTDSAQELKEEEQEGLRFVSLPICVNEKLLDHPIENEDFFALLEEESNVLSTSQPSPSAFEEVFEELTSRGDEVIALLLSSSLSGTYNSARLALLDHEAWQENVHLIDSGQACLSQSVLVARALELRNAGKSAKEIIETIEKEKKQVRLFAMLPTLKYLKKGGRISPAKAALADLAGVRALVTIDENGEISACAKTRGTKKGIRRVAELAADCGIDENRPVFVGYTGLDEQPMRDLQSALREVVGQEILAQTAAISQMLSVHVGPGACGIAFLPRED